VPHVRRLAPPEAIRVGGAKCRNQRDAGFDRPEGGALLHVNLAPAAARARVFVKRRLEYRRAEADTAQLETVHRVGETLRADPRRPDQLERSRRPPSF
jgi:hypothetical protein